MHFFRGKDRVQPMKSNSNVDMNYFQQHRWQLITLLEKCTGCWPYQSKLAQYPLLTLHLFVISTLIFAMMHKLREFVGVDTEMTLECILSITYAFALMVKLALAFKFQDRRRKIYEEIVKHFDTITDAKEARVLEECANRGFKYAVMYLSAAIALLGLFASTPSIRLLYCYLFSHGELQLAMPVAMDYGVDHKKFWYIILLHFLACYYTGAVIAIVFDMSFILQIRHLQGLFEIVIMRLNKATDFIFDNDSAKKAQDVDEPYVTLSTAIDLHSECFAIVKMIEESYTVSWCVIMLMNSGFFGAGIYVMSSRLYDSVETFRNMCLFVVLITHFYVISSQGQYVMDSSSTIHEACYDCKWYGLPKKSCKDLSIIMMRSRVPCQLTGANMFPLSVVMFCKMFKAGMSIYAVLQK